MNGPLHPAIVHLPVALALLLPLLAAGAAFAIHRKKLPRWVWGAVIALEALLVGSGALAMRSGEADEERVEAVVPEGALEAHEEAATIFVGAAGVALAIGLLAAALPSARARAAAMAATALGLAGVAFLAFQVGRAGGELVYAHGAASAYAAPGGAVPLSTYRGDAD
jgi:hypothetical protein